jgi:hypothetical protein
MPFIMRIVRPSLCSGRIAALNTSALAFASLRPNKALELMRPLRGRQFSAASKYTKSSLFNANGIVKI